MGTNGRRNESRNREWLMNGFSQESTPDTIIENGNFGFSGHQPAGPNELFAGEQVIILFYEIINIFVYNGFGIKKFYDNAQKYHPLFKYLRKLNNTL